MGGGWLWGTPEARLTFRQQSNVCSSVIRGGNITLPDISLPVITGPPPIYEHYRISQQDDKVTPSTINPNRTWFGRMIESIIGFQKKKKDDKTKL